MPSARPTPARGADLCRPLPVREHLLRLEEEVCASGRERTSAAPRAGRRKQPVIFGEA